jgi:hypothetical protein
MDWIHLAWITAQCRNVVNTAMNLWVPQNAAKFLTNCTTGALSRRVQVHGVSYCIHVSYSCHLPLKTAVHSNNWLVLFSVI